MVTCSRFGTTGYPQIVGTGIGKYEIYNVCYYVGMLGTQEIISYVPPRRIKTVQLAKTVGCGEEYVCSFLFIILVPNTYCTKWYLRLQIKLYTDQILSRVKRI